MPKAPLLMMLTPLRTEVRAVSMALSWVSVKSVEVGAEVPGCGMDCVNDWYSVP